ncbi:hypothetical protein DRJ22_03185 [Candidatus Woesearchaeota archaeon]|nr:MAG: hypothetical protein DRJ22_03185 [Candidatus Woesearchaeota archaeon]
MKRKVIQIADSTQLISLPRKWAKKLNIKKGDEIEVVEDNDKLIISTRSSAAKLMRTSLDITGFEEIIPRLLHSFYKNGFDEVELLFKDPKVISKIQKSLRDEMIGFEIVEQRPGSCLIKTIAGTNRNEYDSVLRRTFILLKLMFEGIVEALEKRDTSQIQDLKLQEITNNKYTAFCRRVINKFGIHKDYPALEYCIIEWLEKIADQAKYLCSFILESKENIKINKTTLNLYKRVLKLLNISYEVYYHFDLKKAKEGFLERKKIIREALPLFNKSESKRHIHYIVCITQIIADIIGFEYQLGIKNQKTSNLF